MSRRMQDLFAAALTDSECNVPAGLTAWTGKAPVRRFGVYRNNVHEGLIGALASRFPVTEKLVGRPFFAAMGDAFIQAHPPRSPVLLNYGDDFAAFAEGFEAAAPLPYLADVIRLEAARSRAYHAADATPLAPEAFAALTPETLATIRLEPHPSLAILRSAHPVIAIWAMNSGDRAPEPLEHWEGEDALIVRPFMTVEVHALPPGGATFLESLAAGAPLGEAVARAMEAEAGFDLSRNLAGMISAGAFTAILQEETPHDP